MAFQYNRSGRWIHHNPAYYNIAYIESMTPSNILSGIESFYLNVFPAVTSTTILLGWISWIYTSLLFKIAAFVVVFSILSDTNYFIIFLIINLDILFFVPNFFLTEKALCLVWQGTFIDLTQRNAGWYH